MEKQVLERAKSERNDYDKTRSLRDYEKYRLLNLRTVADKGTVEFRAFAGTLNIDKVLHHLATCFGAVRYAAVVKRAQWGVNTKNWWADAGNGENALRLLWAVFGWQAASSSSTHAFGLTGALYTLFASYHKRALSLSKQFDQRFPSVVLNTTGNFSL